MMPNDKRRVGALLSVLWAGLLLASPAAAADDVWAAYLDYAYVYSSADADALRARLNEYGREAGMPLEKYISREFPGGDADDGAPFDEAKKRREAIAFLLHYLAVGEPTALERSVDAVVALEDHLGRHENRYWYHYVMAHRALDRGDSFAFVGEVLDLWLGVVVPLETPYETLHTLSLSDSPNSGFVSALPYVFENLSRLVLIRSQEMGMTRDLDPLAAVVRLLHDGRVGSHPDVIPVDASSYAYLDRIVARLDGPESDNGSLTFTLALFEATKYHDAARGLLATHGLDGETVRAIELAAGAYETALNRAETVQGQAAVYARVLRQLGEVYAAKQRLGVDPDIEIPFTLEGAMETYRELQRGLHGGWAELGFASVGREAYLTTLQGLWEEIQETSLNAADYYLSRSVKSKFRSDEHARNAARIYDGYLAFFKAFATAKDKEGVPEAAYFAAFEAARGYGDAMLRYGTRKPTPAEVDLATQRYKSALRIFPFDHTVWASMTEGLERQGRENDYLEIARPVADAVARSRAVNVWIENEEPGFAALAAYRRAFSDSLALMYLGFSTGDGVGDIEASLGELRAKRGEIERELDGLTIEREQREQGDYYPASPAADASDDGPGIAELNRRISLATERMDKLDKQIAARTRALPLFQDVLQQEDLAGALRVQRDHKIHTLLRRMYHESRGVSVSAQR
ncbi:MAG: hypothetical protein KC560_07605 [Myxococcales bacterium]|nr:hypothetical protein [Myxococcales bacterium]